MALVYTKSAEREAKNNRLFTKKPIYRLRMLTRQNGTRFLCELQLRELQQTVANHKNRLLNRNAPPGAIRLQCVSSQIVKCCQQRRIIMKTRGAEDRTTKSSGRPSRPKKQLRRRTPRERRGKLLQQTAEHTFEQELEVRASARDKSDKVICRRCCWHTKAAKL